jgi:hypothetical protein
MVGAATNHTVVTRKGNGSDMGQNETTAMIPISTPRL